MSKRKRHPVGFIPFHDQLTEAEIAKIRARWESLTTAERNAMIVPVDRPTWLQRWLRRLRGRRS